MDSNSSSNNTLAQPPAEPKEGYVTCKCCGAILALTNKEGGMTVWYIYANPMTGPRLGMANRRVTARVLDGDVYCPYCQVWHALTVDRTWERRWERRPQYR